LKRRHDNGMTEQRAAENGARRSLCDTVATSRTSNENSMKNQSVSLSVATLQVAASDGGSRAVVTARAARVRIPLLLALIHLCLGLVGRAIGLLEGSGFSAGEALRVLLAGIAVDAGHAARFLLPAAALLILLPGRWYRSFPLWMLIGLASFASITLSVGFAVERARGAVTQSASELLATATSAGSLWLEHPVTAALLIASLAAALLLGPVRRAARSSVEAVLDRDG
jgi:hypothetical protein